MSRAFLSWENLFRDKLNDFGGRLATVWFDEVILQTPRQDMIEAVLDRFVCSGDMNSSTADQLLKCWLPIQTLLPDYRFLENAFESDNKVLKNIAYDVTSEFTKKNHPDVTDSNPGFIHEVAMAGAGLIDTISAWSTINEREGCTLLANERESAAIDKVFSVVKQSGIDAFSEIASARIPNMQSLSWERIVDLRNHPHLESIVDPGFRTIV